jgi:hypothetical protein
LSPLDKYTSNPIATVSCGKHSFSTNVHTATLNPVFNTGYAFHVPASHGGSAGQEIVIKVC